jgi:two-component system, NarL family, response regulator DesR
MNDILSIVAIDDNTLALTALERWLTATDHFRWLGGVSTVEALFPLLQKEQPDLLLLDVDMPGVDTFQLLSDITAQYPTIRVVMFSGFVRADYVERALAAGAAGYVIKEEPMAVTVGLLRRAFSGECVLSDSAAAAFMQGS